MIKCYECKGRCNKRGFPSVMRGSAFCDVERGVLTDKRASIWQRIREKMFARGFRL